MGQKITELTESTAAGETSLLIVREGATGNLLKQITKANLLSDYAKNTTAALANYVIEKVDSTYYARPSGSYTAYSGATAATVINAAINALTAGGTIYFRAGTYTITDEIVDGGRNNIKLIFEKGAILYAADMLGSIANDKSVIHLTSCSNWLIDGVTIDGNWLNQESWGVVPNVHIPGPMNSGILIRQSTNCVVDNAYIYNCNIFGFYVDLYCVSCGIMNSYVTNVGWNPINIANGSQGYNNFAINCDASHGSDVGISIIGLRNKVLDCYIHDMDGTTGSNSARWSMSMETGDGSSSYNIVRGNRIVGGELGISLTTSCQYNIIDGNLWIGSTGSTLQGIIGLMGTFNNILNNIFNTSDIDVVGILVTGNDNNIRGNHFTTNTSAINVNGADRTTVVDNWFKTTNDYAISIGYASSDNTRIFGNDFNAGFAVRDEGTGTIFGDDNRWIDGSVGRYNRAVTATSDGLTTGILLTAHQDITVTSASANNIVCLPAASAATKGAVLRGIVGSNGFELRVQAAQATTVYINGVTTNVEAAIPASTTFEITCIDATHWILKAWTALGAVITAIVPDAV